MSVGDFRNGQCFGGALHTCLNVSQPLFQPQGALLGNERDLLEGCDPSKDPARSVSGSAFGPAEANRWGQPQVPDAPGAPWL